LINFLSISPQCTLGFIWDVLGYRWGKGFLHFKQFVETNGHARVPDKYKTTDGFRLGTWVGTQRQKKDKLTPERRSRLDKLGFVWKIK